MYRWFALRQITVIMQSLAKRYSNTGNYVSALTNVYTREERERERDEGGRGENSLMFIHNRPPRKI